ncbi:MAG: DUF6241 domain-containing protein [bacterium]|nr:DUF6241 domain-containing protein [bacterium]
MALLLITGCSKSKGIDAVLNDGYEMSNEAFNHWLETGEADLKDFRDKPTIWQAIHQMSHHVIEAREKWGYQPLTEERVNYLIVEIAESTKFETDFGREQLLDIVIRWKEGDFSRADHDHNTVWNNLGGTIGRASGVHEDRIPAWAIANQEAKLVINLD